MDARPKPALSIVPPIPKSELDYVRVVSLARKRMVTAAVRYIQAAPRQDRASRVRIMSDLTNIPRVTLEELAKP